MCFAPAFELRLIRHQCIVRGQCVSDIGTERQHARSSSASDNEVGRSDGYDAAVHCPRAERYCSELVCMPLQRILTLGTCSMLTCIFAYRMTTALVGFRVRHHSG